MEVVYNKNRNIINKEKELENSKENLMSPKRKVINSEREKINNINYNVNKNEKDPYLNYQSVNNNVIQTSEPKRVLVNILSTERENNKTEECSSKDRSKDDSKPH